MRNLRGQGTFPLALALVAALASFASPVSANHDETVYDLGIEVWDHNGHQLAVVSPADVLTLPRYDPVTLRMFTERNGQRVYLPTEWRVARGSEVLNHYGMHQQRGETKLELRDNAMVGGPLYMEYTLLDGVRLSTERLRRGSVRVEIADNLYGSNSGSMPQASTEQLVAAMYRGVLLREPDPQGARNAVDEIRKRGWAGLLEVAQHMAASRESQVEIYRNGVSNQQRLTALYRELLDLEPREVDSYTWHNQLERLGAGDIASVVMEIIDSQAFQQHFGLVDGARLRR